MLKFAIYDVIDKFRHVLKLPLVNAEYTFHCHGMMVSRLEKFRTQAQNPLQRL